MTIDMTRTKRCVDCNTAEHTPAEMCHACGRCAVHCHQTTLCKAPNVARSAALQAELNAGVHDAGVIL